MVALVDFRPGLAEVSPRRGGASGASCPPRGIRLAWPLTQRRSSMDAFANHSCHLLQQLHDQRIQGLLCDCMLVVKGVSFKAHKNVLAAFSQYFRTLFQNSPSQKNDVFHLDIKNVGGIGQILDYMYTSQLDLNQDNIHHLLDIARCLQVQNILNLCHSFLKTSQSIEQPASLTDNDTFSLPNTHCGPHDVLHVCSTAACKAFANQQPGSQPCPLHSSSAERAKPKEDSMDPSGADLPHKQPNGHYKLRNFYSKQFYKPTICPSSKELLEPPPDFLMPAAQETAHDAALRNNGYSECALESSDRPLPPPFLARSFNGHPEEQEAEGTSVQPAKQLRLKKAIHLQNLNLLRSEKAPEQSSRGDPDGAVAKGAELGSQSGAKQMTTLAVSEREHPNGLVSSECVEEPVELELSQEPSGPDSPLKALLTERQYPCTLCGKVFKHPSNLELHVRSHTGEKPFECNICGKCFSQAGNLQTHLRRHSGEKPFICEICGKRFAASGDVQRHIIIHSGEKPHLCDICGRGFGNFSNLKEHKKNHAAEKVFTCDECGKSFNLSRKLVKHRIRHTGEKPYNCSVCGKCFVGSGDLRRHIRTHTGEKPYHCEACNNCFSRSAVLRRHKKTHCKGASEGSAIVDEFSHAMEIPDLEKSQSPDFFTQEISVAFLSASEKCPPHSQKQSPNELGPPGAPFGMSGPGMGKDTPKMSLDPAKLCKSPEGPAQSCTFKEINPPSEKEALQPGTPALVSSSGSAPSSGWNRSPPSSRVAPAEPQNNEGPFSSMTLWGLAMKTLQNESELGQ